MVIPPAPRPDKESLSNKIWSATHRYATEMGTIDQHLGSMFKNFAKAYILRNVPQVDPSEVKDFSEWVARYPGGRAQFFKDLREIPTHSKRDYTRDSFLKKESYPQGGEYRIGEPYEEFKPARSINHAADIFAAYLGPAISAADKALFKVRIRQGSGFVKGTDPSTWGTLQEALFGSEPVCATDFTSFEAHHSGVFAEVVAFWLNHALRTLGLPCSIRAMIRDAVLGTNKIRMEGLRMQIVQRLMSGNLWTSSANGLLNLLINSFLFVYRRGKSIEKMVDQAYYFKILVEGDDAVFQYHANNRHLIPALGLRYKIEEHRHYGAASFCSTFRSIVNLKSYYDPRKFLKKFWVLDMAFDCDKSDKHMMRAKALSYGTLYPHVPVIADACRDVLERTRGYDVRRYLTILRDNEYKFRNLPLKPSHMAIGGKSVTAEDRGEFFELFGIPINTQHAFVESLRKNQCDIDAFGLLRPETIWHSERYLSTDKSRTRSYERVNDFYRDELMNPIPGWDDNRPCFSYRTRAFLSDEYASLR